MRGRPPTFTQPDREYLADLIREHGIRGARRKSRISVCQQTLCKIAREFKIPLRRGNRSKSAV
jgi:hypothetical protein